MTMFEFIGLIIFGVIMWLMFFFATVCDIKDRAKICKNVDPSEEMRADALIITLVLIPYFMIIIFYYFGIS